MVCLDGAVEDGDSGGVSIFGKTSSPDSRG